MSPQQSTASRALNRLLRVCTKNTTKTVLGFVAVLPRSRTTTTAPRHCFNPEAASRGIWRYDPRKTNTHCRRCKVLRKSWVPLLPVPLCEMRLSDCGTNGQNERDCEEGTAIFPHKSILTSPQIESLTFYSKTFFEKRGTSRLARGTPHTSTAVALCLAKTNPDQ